MSQKGSGYLDCRRRRRAGRSWSLRLLVTRSLFGGVHFVSSVSVRTLLRETGRVAPPGGRVFSAPAPHVQGSSSDFPRFSGFPANVQCREAGFRPFHPSRAPFSNETGRRKWSDERSERPEGGGMGPRRTEFAGGGVRLRPLEREQSPAIVSKRFVRVGHLVRVVALLHG